MDRLDRDAVARAVQPLLKLRAGRTGLRAPASRRPACGCSCMPGALRRDYCVSVAGGQACCGAADGRALWNLDDARHRSAVDSSVDPVALLLTAGLLGAWMPDALAHSAGAA